MAKEKKTETPLMKQHGEIKARYPDAILLFRVGDFYETFEQDAIVASKILGITLTKRANGVASSIALAGFPHHSLDTYLHKLVKAGYRVAICDQLEDPKTVKGIVKRGVTELVTPGVAINDKLLDNNSNNFLASLFLNGADSGIAFIDISTGELFVAQGDEEYMDKLLQSFQPSEVVLSKSKLRYFKENLDQKYYTYALEDWIFQYNYGYEAVIKHFEVTSLKGFGIEEWQSATIAAGAALFYLKDTEHPNLQHLISIQRITKNDFLWMDRFTIRNLELLQSSVENGYSLLQSIDNTKTAMGGRLLKRWIIFPLNDLTQINKRLNLVTDFIAQIDIRTQLAEHLKSIADIERLTAKIPLRRINPREVLYLGKSLREVSEIKNLLAKSNNDGQPLSKNLFSLAENIVSCDDLVQYIDKYINPEAPILLSKGNTINEGINAELDDLRSISHNGKQYLAKIQQEEGERTSIPSLKIGFNNVFGYFLEVTNVHKDKVPPEWIRKQTLTSAERYITPELKEYEEKILGAEDKIRSIEQNLFDELLNHLQTFLAPIQKNAHQIGMIDCLYSLAETAIQNKYCRPEMTDKNRLEIHQGRHPVIEQHLPIGEKYIANDIILDNDTQQIIILTGPNMSGKSALLRQVALITLLAHVGSYIPAAQAAIGLTDKIFTRVGASDNLSGGESTFMVEMNETASIINNISDRSLILLDEIGRGTSTYDGISIAWSIVEYIHSYPQKAKTLFATHYHELNELENQFDRIHNFHISHKEIGNKVIFLRKLTPGGSRHSFGIQVAKMAGMPTKLTNRADEILAILEEKNKNNAAEEQKFKQINADTFQLNIFDGLSTDLTKIKELLFATDINTLTPVEALLKLNELKTIVKQYQ